MKKIEIACLGDTHGNINAIQDFVSYNEWKDAIFVLGDCGFGFKPTSQFPTIYRGGGYIAGNHDSPLHIKSHPSFLGRFGYIEELDLFFISGAWSIDYKFRVPYKSWWPDEELSDYEFGQAYDLYVEKKPKIVISHDCPEINYPNVMSLGLGYIPSRTSVWLQKLWNDWQPEWFIHGHHHKHVETKIQKTNFVCVNIDETFKLTYEI